MSTPLNPINVRTPEFDLETPEGRQAGHRYLASGVVDLNQAIVALNDKVNTIQPSIETTIIQSSSGGGGGGGQIVGGVNDQIGVTSYTTQQSDYGVKIIVGDTSPITINLNPGVTTPWFTVIDNDSSSVASLSPGVPALLQGEPVIDPGCFGIIYFDGSNFWCGATKIATDSSLGYVQPDGVTITIDSSGIIHAASGPADIGINSQTSNYSVASSDLGKIVQMNSASTTTVTLPVTFATGFYLWVKNVGAGACSVTPTSGNIDNHSSWVLSQWQATQFYWDGSLWRVLSESLAV